jgi:hypothetical protein
MWMIRNRYGSIKTKIKEMIKKMTGNWVFKNDMFTLFQFNSNFLFMTLRNERSLQRSNKAGKFLPRLPHPTLS